MPNRPPREWFQRCVEGVAASGSGVDPGAVCGAVWARKDEHERRAIARVEAPMAAKRKKKHVGKRHAAAPAAHRKPKHHRAKKGAAKRSAQRKTERAPAARHARTKHETRCSHCGHAAAHARGQGCLHFDGRRFCSCKHRG
jgi:sRNA-binding protein